MLSGPAASSSPRVAHTRFYMSIALGMSHTKETAAPTSRGVTQITGQAAKIRVTPAQKEPGSPLTISTPPTVTQKHRPYDAKLVAQPMRKFEPEIVTSPPGAANWDTPTTLRAV
jgi:hypothetical protein